MTNSLEICILKALLNKDIYNKYYKYIIKLELEKEIEVLLRAINKYYNTYDHHEYIAPDELSQYFYSQFPDLKGKEVYDGIIHQLKTLEVSDSLTADIVRKLTAKNWAYETIDFLLTVADGSAPPEKLFELPALFEEYKTAIKEQDEDSSPFIDYTPDELFGSETEVNGLTYPIYGLHDALGPVPGRTLGHVFARVEIGKTTFLSHCLSHWAQELHAINSEQLILGCFNEEAGRRINSRIYHSMLNFTPEECVQFVREKGGPALYDLFQSQGGKNLKLVHDTTLSISKITELLENYPIRLMVVDIADHVKLAGAKDGNETQRLNDLYRKFRELADTYNVDFLTSGQANGECAGKRNLYLENMHNSKTDKPGALDYAIGIGHSYDPAEDEFRWLCVCKNKLKATGYRVIDARIDRERGRYYGL